MRFRAFIHALTVAILTTAAATATPDRGIQFAEQILGSNKGGYLTLLTEDDNLGSHYSGRRKTFLVEYSKSRSDAKHAGELGAELRRHLLLDVTTSIHPDDLASITDTVHAQSDETSLAGLLVKYPWAPRKPYDEIRENLEIDSTGGFRFGRIYVVWGGWIKQRLGDDKNSELEWTLEDIREDENCFYFTVGSEHTGHRVVCIAPEKTQQIRWYQLKQPVYLVAGTFQTAEEAVNQAGELMRKTEGKFKAEVWSNELSPGRLVYLVVAAKSTDYIRKPDGFENLQSLVGSDLSVIASDRFMERFEVNEIE